MLAVFSEVASGGSGSENKEIKKNDGKGNIVKKKKKKKK
jgi:hypothetical protein